MTIESLYQRYLQYPIVCTDTRKVRPDSIFFALKGENFNANQFAKDALEGGCTYAVIDEKEYAIDDRFILVEDVLSTLQELARHHRRELGLPVLGITGTNGKTTTKELIRSVLSQKLNVFATEGNLNNHIGVPLSLLSLNREHEFAVIEMGASKPGDIEELCLIAEPDYGIITNIGKAHLEGMGGLEGVLKTKTELYHWLRSVDGKVFLNTGQKKLVKAAEGLEQITYGTEGSEDIVGKMETALPSVSLKWIVKGEDAINETETLQSNLPGHYNFENILAAICIGHSLGLSREEINKGIKTYVPANNRSQVVKKGSNTIIMDAYNANPSSMEVAINNFKNYQGGNNVLILGEMRELGEGSENEHRNLLDLIKSLKFSNVFLVGEGFQSMKDEYDFTFFENTDKLLEQLKSQQFENATVLIKGSRKNQLERVLEVL